MGWYYNYKPYVSVAQREAKAKQEIAKRKKNGEKVSPVKIEGRSITKTFWGNAWCTNLESYSDYENRLPRGRTYVRNGSVVDLQIAKGNIKALVMGSELYKIQISIDEVPKSQWAKLKKQCSGKIGSLVELLQGKLSKSVMEVVTHRDDGLFPKPKEIKMRCSCPDSAGMCKHLAAAMYGVGHRLDSSPELLFLLRAVNQEELIEQALPTAARGSAARQPTIASNDLGAIFGIEMDDDPKGKASTRTPKKSTTTPAKKKPTIKKPTSTKKSTASKKTVSAKKLTMTKSAVASKKSTAAKQPSATKLPATATKSAKRSPLKSATTARNAK